MNNQKNDGFSLYHKQRTDKLTAYELAMALYEGTPHLENLAEKLARHHGQAQAICPFVLAGQDIQNFYMGIAQQLIDHAKEWQKNQGSGCVLSPKEYKRIKDLPRHPELPKSSF